MKATKEIGAGGERKLPITGYWLFICNPNYWAVDVWLALGERQLLYKIPKEYQIFMKPRQQGLLRVGKDQRSKLKRANRPRLEAGIYAWVEIVDEPIFSSDPDPRGYYNQEDANKATWRVKIKILNNMLRKPILSNTLPDEPPFRYIHLPLQRATLPVEESVIKYVLNLSNLDLKTTKRLADTVEGIKYLETEFERSEPKVRQTISHYIERGTIGQKIKSIRKGRCQVCEALGKNEVAFLDRNGRAFSESHHVIPVNSAQIGSLSGLNIMVLCPNHHRQAHYGKFDIIEHRDLSWMIEIDGSSFEIDKATLSVERLR